MNQRCFALAAACLLASATAAAAQSHCLRSNSSGQRVTGTLAIVAGNFIFRADSPVCMRGNEAEDNLNKIAKVHLYTNSDRVRRQLGRLRGQYFEVVGRPFPAHTIHHKAPIVMEVAEIVRI